MKANVVKWRFGLLFICFILGVFFLTGCMNTAKNKVIVEDVLSGIYDCPSADYKEAYMHFITVDLPAMNASSAHGNVVLYTEKNSSIVKYLAKTYNALFTQEAYESLVSNRFFDTFQIESIEAKRGSKITDLSIRWVLPQKYDYTGTVTYWFDSNPEDVSSISIAGSVEFDESNRIKDFTISYSSRVLGE